MLTGGCFCGAVRYQADDRPTRPTLCHCSDCRRVAGAPAVAWFTVQAAAYRVVAGQPARFASSSHAERSFCPTCGTGLTFQSRNSPDEIDIATCSLDQPDLLPPADHTRTASRVAWWDGLPQLPRRPEPPPTL